jgi:hypothetical protein
MWMDLWIGCEARLVIPCENWQKRRYPRDTCYIMPGTTPWRGLQARQTTWPRYSYLHGIDLIYSTN